MRTETFQTPGQVSLDLRLGSGEVRVAAADVQETTVALEPLRDNDATKAAIGDARVELRERAGGHEVVVDIRDRSRGFGVFRGADVLIEVRCPEGADLEARFGSADLEGRGRLGSVEVQSGSGDIELGDISDDAKIETASGDLRVDTVGGHMRVATASGDVQIATVAGDARISTASGDVIVREVGGTLVVNSASGDVAVREARSSVSVNTASGDQAIGSVSQGSVDLKSASGDLTIGIREGSTLWVDARSRSGEVKSDLPVSDVAPEGDAPHVELRANTMSGDVEIQRA